MKDNLVEFEVSPVTIKVTGPDGAKDVLKKALRYKQKGYFFDPMFKRGLWDGYINLYSQYDKFPTGLRDRARDLLTNKGYEVKMSGSMAIKKPKTTEHDLKGIVLRPGQEEAIAKALEHGRGIIKANTSFGKTEVIAGIIQCYDLKTLVITPSKDLLLQTAKRIKERTGIQCGVIGSGSLEPADVTIATFQTLARWLDVPKKRKRETVEQTSIREEKEENAKVMKEWLSTIDLLIVDEVHHLNTAEKWFRVMNSCPAGNRFAFSATPFKEPIGSEMIIIGATSEIIFDHDLAEAIENNIVVKPAVYLITYTSPDLNDEEELNENWPLIYKRGIVQNINRNDAVVAACKAAENANLPTFCMVNRTEHGETLAKELGWPFVRGSMSSSARMKIYDAVNNGTVPGFIATVGSEGLDINNLACIVNAAAGEAAHQVLQRLGRGLRLGKFPFCLMIDFIDDCHRVLDRHSDKRAGTYWKAGVYTGTFNKIPYKWNVVNIQKRVKRFYG